MYHAQWTLESFAQRRSLIKTSILVFAFLCFHCISICHFFRYRFGVLRVRWGGRWIQYRKPTYRIRIRVGRGWRRVIKRGRKWLLKYRRRFRKVRLYKGRVNVKLRLRWKRIRRRISRRVIVRRRRRRRRRRTRRRRRRRLRRYKRRKRRLRRRKRRQLRRCVIRIRRGRRWYPVFRRRRGLRIRFGKTVRRIR